MASSIHNTDMSPEQFSRAAGNKQWLVQMETEDFLRSLSADYINYRSDFWQRDYTSESAYLQSVTINRQRWQAAVGDPELLRLPEPTGELIWEPLYEDDNMVARWLILPVTGGLRAHAVLALPKNRTGRLPLVIAQHGVSSSPESVMGFTGGRGAYKAFGQELVHAGYAVLSPKHVSGGGFERSHLQRMCLMLGLTLWGLEIFKLRKLLDHVLSLPEIDPDRVGMWGLSLGGAYTLMATPIESRIKVAVSSAWFNDRFRKMVVVDPRYSCFLTTDEEHVFIPRWLLEFDDADLASLICPRPLQIQHGKADAIAWWPLVVEAFAQAKAHYEKLGLADKISLELHEGGHEVILESGLEFIARYI